MLTMTICRRIICLTILLVSLSSVNGSNEVTCEVNPSCTDCDSHLISIAHVVSKAHDHTNHFLWSFITDYSPTLFLFETDNSAELSVDYKKIRSKSPADSIQFHNGTVHKAYGMEITNFNFQDSDNINYYDMPLKQLNWNILYDCQNKAVFQFTSVNGTGAMNGTFAFNASVYPTEGRFEQIPHLAFTTSSSILNLQLNNIYSKSFPTDEKKAIFPFANITVAYEGDNLSGNVLKTTSINDEYSPGVFNRFIYEIKENNSNIAFTEWRPVSYYDTDRVVAKSIKVGEPTAVKQKSLEKTSLLNAYFGAESKKNVQLLKNFQFGSSDDSFDYRDNSFISFTMGSGFGEAQPDTLSTTLQIVLFVGLGVPTILVMISAVYTVYLKCSTKKLEFEVLQE